MRNNREQSKLQLKSNASLLQLKSVYERLSHLESLLCAFDVEMTTCDDGVRPRQQQNVCRRPPLGLADVISPPRMTDRSWQMAHVAEGRTMAERPLTARSDQCRTSIDNRLATTTGDDEEDDYELERLPMRHRRRRRDEERPKTCPAPQYYGKRSENYKQNPVCSEVRSWLSQAGRPTI